MTLFIEIRSKIRHFLTLREEWVVRVMRFALSFLSLTLINHVIGYQKILNHWWVSLLIALICTFVPIQGISMIILFIGVIHLTTLATDVAVVALVLLLINYIICSYFQSKETYHLIAGPVCFHLHIPFLMPISTGLLRGMNELPNAVLGAVVAYYLKVVSENASAFMEPNSEMTASILVQSKLLTNPMFYIFVATTAVVCIMVYIIRTSEWKHAWYAAVVSATVTEFILMLAGCLFLDGRKDIPMLAIGSAITLLIGLALTFVVQGADYSRIEKVQFEDDEYYYYVTAVPKMRIAEQDKEVKKITEERE